MECRDPSSAGGATVAVERDGLSTDRGNASGGDLPPKADLGLQILHDCDEPEVDIVAVHGLGANPDYAWVWHPKNNPRDRPGYPNEPINWLQKLLPAKLSCRVLAFNYNSTWILNAPQQRLSNISDSLLDTLRSSRDKEPAVGRPLIFIGHSFGGNVIEQAIVSASRTSSEYLSIAESTVGVVFLGTPHRGCPAAAWGALIASLASLAPPGFVTEDRLLKALEEQSDSLTDRLHDFSRWAFSQSVPLVCAFEQLVTDYSSRAGIVGKLLPSKALVVPESSACIDGHHKISLHTDHFKINKFYGAEDPSFKLVYPHIVWMARSADATLNRRRNPKAIPTDARSTSGNLEKCLQKMMVRNPEDVLADIRRQKGKTVGNTCEWILKRDEFSIWSVSEQPQFLRLIGSPGMGKTMMSTFLVEELRAKVQKSPGKVFAYFFCDDKDQKRKTPTAILRSLTWQLLLQKNELFQHMQPDFEKHSDERVFEDLFNDFSALWRIFQRMLLDDHAGEVFILIDALDECESLTRQDLLISIREFFQPSPAGRPGKVKLLITSRPGISDIERQLKGSGTSLRVDSANISKDLSAYIDSKVNEITDMDGEKYPPALQNKVRSALQAKADGTFLWVSLMLAELAGVPMRHVEQKLESLPQGLNNTYATILNRIPSANRETAKFILRCMVAARRPLKRAEIQTAFAAWENGSIVCREDVSIYDDILSVCSSILFVGAGNSGGNNATLNFCHQSVKDFLLLKPLTIDTWYHTAEDEANAVLFKTCWVYLSAAEFKHGELIFGSETDDKRYPNKWELGAHLYQHLFLDYSSEEWENHAIAGHNALLRDWRKVAIDVTKAPTLRDAWLLRAAREGQDTVVRLLLEKGADIETKDNYSMTPLFQAAESGHEAVVRLLLDKGADIEAKDYYNVTPLSQATAKGHEAVVRLLLDKGANIKSEDIYEMMPLSKAAEKGHEAVVRLLLDKGADIETTDGFSGQTPLWWASGRGHEAVVRLLLEKGANTKVMPLLHAAEKGHKLVVRLLLEKGANIEAKNNFSMTPLSKAAEKGHEAVVQLLLEKGANIEAKTKHRQTPLSLAAGNGHDAVVRLLFEKDADIATRDIFGQTPLWLASLGGHEAVVRLLLTKQNIESESMDGIFGLTPLSCAAMKGHHSTMELLLERDNAATTTCRDIFGRTALSFAVANGHTDVVTTLLNSGSVDLTATDDFGLSLLTIAAKKGYADMHRLLLSKAEDMGLAVQDTHVDSIRSAKPHVSNVCCTFCMLDILVGEVYQKCPTCRWADEPYIRCQACVARRLTCIDDSHEWLEETLKDKKSRSYQH